MAADDLSEAAGLAHYQAIAWVSGTERFDCTIPKRLLPSALPCTLDVPAVTAELSAAHYWYVHPNGDVELLDHAGFIKQSLVTVSKKRVSDTRAAKSYRDKHQPSVTDAVTESVAAPDTESSTRLPTELPTERKGDEHREVPPQASEPWPEVVPPGGPVRENWRIAAKGYDRD